MQHSQCLQSAAVFQGMRNEGRLTPMWDCGAAVAFTLRASLVPSLLPPPIHCAPPPRAPPRDILSVATMTTDTSSPLPPPLLLLLLLAFRTGRRKASRLADRTSSRIAS